jgi:hypothetical protein
VANRSGVGAEALRLHPARKIRRRENVKRVLVLVMFRLDGFKSRFLAAQSLRAETPAMGAMDLFVSGMIFGETLHVARQV